MTGATATRPSLQVGEGRVLLRLRQVAVAFGAAGALLASWLVVQAVIASGNDTFVARLAEAARDDGLGPVVTGLENLNDKLNPPKVGGAPDSTQLKQLATVTLPSPVPVTPRAVTLRPTIAPVDTPALPGEGVYKSLVSVDGQPAVQAAYLRPDTQHTSYLSAVVWMSGRLTRLVQHPGASDPGRPSLWSQPPAIPAAARAGLVATFNGGFKIADSRGGYYADHHTIGTLTPGSASLVIYDDGHADIGSWGGEVSMTPQVSSVRQNLKLLVDHGQLAPNLDDSVQSTWGATLKGAVYVWRSGVGVTASGDLVYVAGDALSAHTLASLLRRAGAVRAMQLDINPSWVSFMWYSVGASPTAVVPHKIAGFQRPADRYFTDNSRDFFAVYAR
ncbi:MAG TPA: phosphodiester glycosidase family protein [Kineosporiaceae bacterium]|nr:phosphodiester glycosidase family protein [Kineosporiaceae bacterium]